MTIEEAMETARELAEAWAASPIEDEDAAREFIRDCVRALGAGFHPDTSFVDYRVGQTETYSEEEAGLLDLRMDDAWVQLGGGVYTVAYDAVWPLVS
jgi:hypothetical protein